MSAVAAPPKSSASSLVKILAAGIVLAALFVLGRHAGARIEEFATWVESLGTLGPVVFIAGYAVAVVALFPAVLLTLSAGAIFGIKTGALYVFVAATIGASMAFLVSRYVARGAVER